METRLFFHDLARKKWHVRGTAGGAVAASAALFFVLYAILLSEPILWFWAFSIVVSFVIQFVLSLWALSRLTPERKIPERITRFMPFLCSVGLYNQSALSIFSLKVQDVIDGVLVDKPCFFFRIGGRSHQSTFYRHAFVHRGCVHYHGFIVSTSHPLGLLRVTLFLPLFEERLVFSDVPLSPSRRVALEQMLEQAPFSLREFVAGDPPHAIHWPASLRSGRLFSRMGMQLQRTVWIQLDNRLLPDERGGYTRPADRFERRLATVAGATRLLLEMGWDVGIITRGDHFSPVAGLQNFEHVMRYLALLSPADGPFPTPPYQDRFIDASTWMDE